MTSRSITTISIILSLSLIVAIAATSTSAIQLTEAGKIKVRYTEVGQYFGKGNIVIKNLDSKKTIVSEKLNFEKQHHSQGKSCCVKTYDFSNKHNYQGDRLFVRVTANGGSWSQHEMLHLPSMSITVDMDEVWCGPDGDECD